MPVSDMARRGRTRKNGMRYASGDCCRVDPRLVVLAQPHRRLLLDGKGLPAGLDQRAETPLGGLNIAGQITDQQYDAGRAYAGIVARYAAVIDAPRSAPKGLTIIASGGAPAVVIDDDEALRRKAEYDGAYEALLTYAGQPVARVVSRVAIYGGTCEADSLPQLRAGLDVLAAQFRLTSASKSPELGNR